MYPSIETLDETLAARCSALSVQEIEQQALDHLIYIFKNLGKYAVFAVTDKDVHGGWYLQQELDQLQSQGDIVAYEAYTGKTMAWQKRFEQDNRQVSFDFVDDFTVHKLCGAALTIRTCEQLCATSVPSPSFTSVDCCAQR